MSFDWVVAQDQEVQWVREARWVKDGKYYTSSGISAGTDMTLGFISDIMGRKSPKKSRHVWNIFGMMIRTMILSVKTI